jgi:hypothetical protein
MDGRVIYHEGEKRENTSDILARLYPITSGALKDREPMATNLVKIPVKRQKKENLQN